MMLKNSKKNKASIDQTKIPSSLFAALSKGPSAFQLKFKESYKEMAEPVCLSLHKVKSA